MGVYNTLVLNNFNPRPPWGGRLSLAVVIIPTADISIHALRGEGDAHLTRIFTNDKNFNPRPPWGGRQVKTPSKASLYDFNPRPPWGGRLVKALFLLL